MTFVQHENVSIDERHVIGFSKPMSGAHIVSVERTEKGVLRVYDSQSGEVFLGERIAECFEDASRIDHFARVDNAILDVEKASRILRMAGSA